MASLPEHNPPHLTTNNYSSCPFSPPGVLTLAGIWIFWTSAHTAFGSMLALKNSIAPAHHLQGRWWSPPISGSSLPSSTRRDGYRWQNPAKKTAPHNTHGSQPCVVHVSPRFGLAPSSQLTKCRVQPAGDIILLDCTTSGTSSYSCAGWLASASVLLPYVVRVHSHTLTRVCRITHTITKKAY